MKKTGFGILMLGLFFGLALLLETPLAEGPVSMSGTIVDEGGHALPGVTVTAVNVNTGVQYTTNTDKKGRFLLKDLPAGNYQLIARISGFHPLIKNGIRIVKGKTLRLELKMRNSLVDPRPKTPEELLEAEVKGMVEGGVTGGVVGGVLGGVVGEVQKPVRRYHMADAAHPSSYHRPDWNTEEYDRIYENIFLSAISNPLSTFSIDVDTASYSNVRRFLNNNQYPYKDAVRIEEMINYFSYDYPVPKGRTPFSIFTEISACPWNENHRLIHIGLQGKKLEAKKLPPSNLVFLLDVSGSMNQPHKLPLLQQAFKLLVKELGNKDRVAIVVYAGAAGLVLPSTSASQDDVIIAAIERLRAGGSTAGGAGIQLAYKVAMDNFLEDGNNRIILATDGDFNIGVSSTSELVRMIEEKRKQGIFLTILGFGMGNYKDGRMERLADKGNGNYHYIDNLIEAKKVFIDDMRGTLFTIAKDVKLQLEFNPAKVKAYRLIGYENRLLKKEDFADDTKDAGELGAGHTVTALYEIIPYGSDEELPGGEDLKYQQTQISREAFKSKEILTVKLRYKEPGGEKSRLIEHPLKDRQVVLAKASDNFKFSAAVAAYGMLLRESEFSGDATFSQVLELAREGRGPDFHGYRSEFIRLVEKTQLLQTIAAKNK